MSITIENLNKHFGAFHALKNINLTAPTGKLEQYDVQGASAVALFMLLISFSILFALNIAQWALGKRAGAKA